MAHNVASKDLHINKIYTSLRILGGVDCGPTSAAPDLDVRGGAQIGKTLCVQGNIVVNDSMLIQGDLVVLGNTTIKQDEIIITKDKKICMAVPGANVIASNILADGAGIIVSGPDPDQSKSIIWYLNGPSGTPWWNFNQNINLGPGRKSFDPICGGDEGLSGHTFRIYGDTVLSHTSLGSGVVASSLETVGQLQTGSVNHYISISAIAPGNPAKITTVVAHGLAIGDNVRLSGTNSSPAIDGCYTVTSVVSPTMVFVNASVTLAGNAGQLAGVLFPINIGTSTLTCGTVEIQCCGNLAVKDDSNIERFVVRGCTGKTIINYEDQDCALQVNADYMGDYSSEQNAVCIDNATNNNDLSGISCALDIQQSYYGTNTVYANAASTIQVIGQCINVSTSYKVPNVKISNVGLEITTVSPNNVGANFGIIAEAGGKADVTQQTIGVSAIANDGVVRIGVLGCINTSQTQLAGMLQNLYALGGLHTGGFFCNANVAPNEYALYSDGLSYFNGPMNVAGNISFTSAMGNSLIANVVCVKDKLLVKNIVEKVADDGVTVTGNLLPSVTDTYSLGSMTHLWKNMFTDNLYVTGHLFANISSNVENVETLHVHNLFAGNAAVTGNLSVDYIYELTPGHGVNIDGVLLKDGNVSGDFIQALTLCANVLLTDVIKPKHHPSILIEGNLIPSPSNEYTLGNITNVWKSLYVKDIVINGNLSGLVDLVTQKVTVDIVDANIAMIVLASIYHLHTDKLSGIGGNSIVITNNLLPSNSNALSLGSPTNVWSNIFTENLHVSGIAGVPLQLGCTFSLGNTIKVAGNLGNNNVFFAIADVPTYYHEAMIMEARVTGITSDASASYSSIIRAGILNNGSPPNNLIRMTGTDQTVYQTNALNWKVRLSPNVASSITGNNVQVQASYDQTGTPKAVTWKACVNYYPVAPM